jgi:deazaflavin-dependent oxidoreductase (nitroreductase family)
VPLPRRLAKFNLVVTNPVLRPLARYVPGFAVVTHVGRRSGRRHTVPVSLFRRGDGFVVALFYGADSQWVRNVVAAGGAEIEARGRRVRLERPEVVRDPARSMVPRPVRPILRVLGVDAFLLLDRAAS